MAKLTKGLIALASLGFLLAVLAASQKIHILGITAEGFSRGCSNCALLAIALLLASKE